MLGLMPEGDTLARTARAVGSWLGGRVVTGVRGSALGPGSASLVGCVVRAVESRGKHLLVHLARGTSGLVLHTHLRMTGSWHVYPAGQAWSRPEAQARLVVVCGDRVAVCFNAPVVEVLDAARLGPHPVLGRLGPDLLAPTWDVGEVVARARRCDARLALGELLLDQTVAAGIGNIWRCEALHAAGLSPWDPQSVVGDTELGRLFAVASELMAASVGGTGDGVIGRPRARVYGRAGRPCRSCGSMVVARRQGPMARTAYWCEACQPRRGPAPDAEPPGRGTRPDPYTAGRP